MRYTVLWAEEAEEQLAQLWLDAALRDSVTKAAHVVEASLAINPSEAGESRASDRRIFITPPLVVDFEVHSADRTVRVLQVRLMRNKNRG